MLTLTSRIADTPTNCYTRRNNQRGNRRTVTQPNQGIHFPLPPVSTFTRRSSSEQPLSPPNQVYVCAKDDGLLVRLSELWLEWHTRLAFTAASADGLCQPRSLLVPLPGVPRPAVVPVVTPFLLQPSSQSSTAKHGQALASLARVPV